MLKLSCDVPQPLFQRMPSGKGWYYVWRAPQEHNQWKNNGFERAEGSPLRAVGRAIVRDRFGPALRPRPLRLHSQWKNLGFEREEGSPLRAVGRGLVRD